MNAHVEKALTDAGDAGLTLAELSSVTHLAPAYVRNALAAGTFIEHRVTIVPGTVSDTKFDGKLTSARFCLGDPTELLLAG